MQTFRTRILTPEKCVFDEEVDALVVPGPAGSFGVLARHAPMIAAVGAGILKVSGEAGTRFIAVSNGLLQAGENAVLLLADSAIPASDEYDAEEKLAVVIAEAAPRGYGRAQTPAA